MSLGRVRYDVPTEGVARVTLARPEKANAQDFALLQELDRALCTAMEDDRIRVVVLASDGKHFSAGHDLSCGFSMEGLQPVNGTGGFAQPGPHGHMATEEEMYLGLSWRWRNMPKPIVAQVQGKCIAGGLMLVWPCDIIVASEDATFSDPTVAFGVNGHEYFTHAWELSPRQAKEMLFLGGAWTAEDCARAGMVNHVVPREELESFTLKLAAQIALRPAMGLKLAKLAVNQSLDAQGQYTALRGAFALHQTGHAHNAVLYDGDILHPDGAETIRALSR